MAISEAAQILKKDFEDHNISFIVEQEKIGADLYDYWVLKNGVKISVDNHWVEMLGTRVKLGSMFYMRFNGSVLTVYFYQILHPGKKILEYNIPPFVAFDIVTNINEYVQKQ